MNCFLKRYGSYALSFVAIGIIAFLIIACPASGSESLRYSCLNGRPVTGEASADGIARCASCNAGFRLSDEHCNASCTESSGTYTLGDPEGNNTLTFRMIAVPVGGGLNFFTGVSDNTDATVDATYDIAETELTYAVYRRVQAWATTSERGASIYDLPAGRKGGNSTNCGSADSDEASRAETHPVTCISWYDSLKFANALSEYCALTPVYENSGAVMRSGTAVPTLNSSANGFRLPERTEWELAARYINNINNDGDIKDSNEFYPGNYASGATANFNNAAATGLVAWYRDNSSSMTHPVGEKTPNALGLSDMSGNVLEWTFSLLSANRVILGGSWFNFASFMRVGGSLANNPASGLTRLGIRLVR